MSVVDPQGCCQEAVWVYVDGDCRGVVRWLVKLDNAWGNCVGPKGGCTGVVLGTVLKPGNGGAEAVVYVDVSV